jgi:hypothetical protein
MGACRFCRVRSYPSIALDINLTLLDLERSILFNEASLRRVFLQPVASVSALIKNARVRRVAQNSEKAGFAGKFGQSRSVRLRLIVDNFSKVLSFLVDISEFRAVPVYGSSKALRTPGAQQNIVGAVLAWSI